MATQELLFLLMSTRSRNAPLSGQKDRDLSLDGPRKVRVGFMANQAVVPDDFNEWARDEIEQMFNGDCKAI